MNTNESVPCEEGWEGPAGDDGEFCYKNLNKGALKNVWNCFWHCNNVGAEVVMPKTEKQSADIVAAYNKGTTSPGGYWIGLARGCEPGKVGQGEDGKWVWHAGKGIKPEKVIYI